MFEQRDHIWAEMMSLILDTMDRALKEAKIISDNELEKLRKFNVKTGYAVALNNAMSLKAEI